MLRQTTDSVTTRGQKRQPTWQPRCSAIGLVPVWPFPTGACMRFGTIKMPKMSRCIESNTSCRQEAVLTLKTSCFLAELSLQGAWANKAVSTMVIHNASKPPGFQQHVLGWPVNIVRSFSAQPHRDLAIPCSGWTKVPRLCLHSRPHGGCEPSRLCVTWLRSAGVGEV